MEWLERYLAEGSPRLEQCAEFAADVARLRRTPAMLLPSVKIL